MSNYCSACCSDETVHDYDLRCCKCGVCLHSECITKRDAVTRLLIWFAAFRVYGDSTLPNHEEEQFLEDIQSAEFDAFFREHIKEYGGWSDGNEERHSNIQIMENSIQRILAQKKNGERLIIKEFFEENVWGDWLSDNFVCNMCFHNIQVKY